MILLMTIVFLLFLKFIAFLWDKRHLIKFLRSIRNDLDSNLISGHTSYIIGDAEKRMKAFQLFGREAIKQGGLTKASSFHKCFLMVADAEICDFILKNCLEKADFLKQFKSFIGNGSILAPDSIWRSRRKVSSPAFSQRQLNKFVPIFDKCSRRMIQQLKHYVGKESFSVWKYINAYSMDAVCITGLDVDFDIQSNPKTPFLNAFEKYIEMASHRVCSPWLHNDTVYSMIPWYSVVKTHISLMWNFVNDIIHKKRQEHRNYVTDTISNQELESVIDFLVKPSKDVSFTDLEIGEELLVILLAGTDTSATGAAFILSMLSKSTSIRERVHTELREVFGDSDRTVTVEDLQKLKYLEAVVRETLRLYPPGPMIARTADRDVTLPIPKDIPKSFRRHSEVIPKDCDILLNLWATQRNPRYWGADAEEFKPERFLNGQQNHAAAFVVFSAGPRKCLGYQYALLSLKTVVCNLLRSFDVRHPTQDEPVEEINKPLRVKFDIMMKDVDNFRIRLENKV